MDDITTTQAEVVKEVKEVKKATKKRSTLFMVLASILLVLLLGVFGGLAYWGYQNYLGVSEDSSSVNNPIVPISTKTTEEKDLDKTADDLKADESLSTDDAEAQAADIESIDISGL